MKVNQKIVVEILRLGDNGEGIAEFENLVIFIPFALIGEKVKIRIDHITKRYAFATLLEVLNSNSNRVTPKCKYFGKCGGCDIQHMDYDSQLKLKQEILKDCLRKFSGRNLEVNPTVKSDLQFGYRNKIQLPIGYVNKKIVVGFYKKGSHEIVPMESCPLHGDWADKLIDITLKWANKYKITAYNEKSHKGLLRHIVARYVSNNLCVTLVINGDNVLNINKYAQMLESNFKDFSLFVCINKKKTNVILTNNIKTIIAPKNLINVDGVKCEISPLSFFQVNNNVREKLYQAVVNAVGNKNDIVIDAYSGIGVLTNYLAQKNNEIYGIEIVEDAIKNANILATNNGNFNKICNICGDTALILPQLVNLIKDNKSQNAIEKFFKKENSKTNMSICQCEHSNDKIQHSENNILENNVKVNTLSNNNDCCSNNSVCNCSNCDCIANNEVKVLKSNGKVTVVLDPPRKGCDISVLQSVIDSNADTVVYISCNPTTLARDLKHLLESYTPVSITPYDMFPNTSHLETLAWLKRK